MTTEADAVLEEMQRFEAAFKTMKDALGGQEPCAPSTKEPDSLQMVSLVLLWEELVPHLETFVQGVEQTFHE